MLAGRTAEEALIEEVLMAPVKAARLMEVPICLNIFVHCEDQAKQIVGLELAPKIANHSAN